MAVQMRFAKVTALPSTYTPNTMYMVNDGSGPGKIWVSDSTGTTVTEFGGSQNTPETTIHPFMLMGAN